ncbi:MAG: hypothetical protein JO062_28455 [Bryobacterales bacterium]|nr:hypothetical protein [Bryobacterales bacterium]
MRALVEAGALARVQLQKAEDAVADAMDGSDIRKSIYLTDLTEEQAMRLVAAANRRFERRKTAFEQAKLQVDAGIAPANVLEELGAQLDYARKDRDLAATRADLARQATAMAEAESAAALQTSGAEHPPEASPVAERYDGNGVFTPEIFARIQTAFDLRFGKLLPVSANGETAVHRALGFDHRGRVDVALRPDQPEGIWLRDYLRAHRVPYFAFNQAVPGKATGAHIHLGPMSPRLVAANGSPHAAVSAGGSQ